ncbi:MAG: bifunctional nuclease family protein [Myxococcota bacterium]|nr:bifunctional nuclease family protein [Myxococcota bacterium]
MSRRALPAVSIDRASAVPIAGIAALAAASALLAGCSRSGQEPDLDIPVEVGTVVLDHRNAPVVILEETDGIRALPIWIGTAEASSIASHINDRPPPRPNSHDFAQKVIRELDAVVVRVVVTELRGGTYYAILTLRSDGREIEIDVRPSDGIAVALRTQAPILVRASVFAEAGEEIPGRESEREI